MRKKIDMPLAYMLGYNGAKIPPNSVGGSKRMHIPVNSFGSSTRKSQTKEYRAGWKAGRQVLRRKLKGTNRKRKK